MSIYIPFFAVTSNAYARHFFPFVFFDLLEDKFYYGVKI